MDHPSKSMGAMRSAACAGRFFLGFSGGAELRILGCSTLSRFKFNVYNPPPAAPNPLLTNPAKGFTPSLQHRSFCFVVKPGAWDRLCLRKGLSFQWNSLSLETVLSEKPGDGRLEQFIAAWPARMELALRHAFESVPRRACGPLALPAP